MKIVIPGGTGQVGTILTRSLTKDGHDVVILSRNSAAGSAAQPNARHVTWDGRTLGDWATQIEDADVVINLAGRSVNCRYNTTNRRAILDSRVLSTRIIGEAIAAARRPPKVWLQASTATIYSHTFDRDQDERNGILGGTEPNAPDTWRFSIDVAKAWEEELEAARTPQTRKVLLRSAMTMSPDPGGVFDTLSRLVRLGLGGPVGSGKQYVSWIHEADFVNSVKWVIAHADLSGPINIASPNPLPYTDFMRTLRQAWGVKVGLPATEWMLEIACWLMRTESELVLKSRRVVPRRLLENGFQFSYPNWQAAADELVEGRRIAPPMLASAPTPTPAPLDQSSAGSPAPPLP